MRVFVSPAMQHTRCSRSGSADGTGLRVDHRESGSVSVWEADRELSGTGAVGGLERMPATAVIPMLPKSFELFTTVHNRSLHQVSPTQWRALTRSEGSQLAGAGQTHGFRIRNAIVVNAQGACLLLRLCRLESHVDGAGGSRVERARTVVGLSVHIVRHDAGDTDRRGIAIRHADWQCAALPNLRRWKAQARWIQRHRIQATAVQTEQLRAG
jgi:hypothetical protein